MDFELTRCLSTYLLQGMDWFDLNEPPLDFGNLDIGNGLYDEHVELVDESPDPDVGIDVDNGTAPGGVGAGEENGGAGEEGGEQLLMVVHLMLLRLEVMLQQMLMVVREKKVVQQLLMVVHLMLLLLEVMLKQMLLVQLVL